MVWPLTSSTSGPSTTAPSAAAPAEVQEQLIYMHFPGIEGPVTEKGYEGWMKLDDLQWGAGIGISSGGYDSDDDVERDEAVFPDRETTDPSISEVTVDKDIGLESRKILYYMLTKKPIDVKIDVVVRRTSPNASPTLTRTMSYTLNHTLLSGISTRVYSAQPSKELKGATNESLSLNYGGIESVSYDAAGVPVDSVHYHLSAGRTTYKAWSKEKEAFEVVEVKKNAKKAKEQTNETSGEEAKVEEVKPEETEGEVGEVASAETS